MKRYAFILSAILIALVCAVAFAPAQVEEYAGAIVQAWNYLYVKSGGTLEIETGGTLVAESGGTINLDAGSTFGFDDDAAVAFGNSSDATAAYNSTADRLQIVPDSDVSIGMDIGSSDKAMDLRWFSTTTGATVTFDATAENVAFVGVDLTLNDNDELRFGNSNDVTATWNSTSAQMELRPAADGTDLNIFDFDVELGDSHYVYFGDDGDAYLGWNSGAGKLYIRPSAGGSAVLNLDGVGIELFDGDNLAFGNTQDATMGFNADASDTLQVGPVLGGYADYRGLSNRLVWDWVAGSCGLPTTAGLVSAGTNDLSLVLQGTNASADDITYATAYGGLKLETDGSDGDEVILWPYSSDGSVGASTPSLSLLVNTNWTADKHLRWEALIKTGGTVANGITWAGMKQTNTEVLTTDTDGIWFRTENDSAIMPNKWVAVFNRSNVDYQYDTGLTFAVNTQYHLLIDVDRDQLPRFYVNGALVASGTKTVNAGVNLWPVVGTASDGTTANRSVLVQRENLSRGF